MRGLVYTHLKIKIEIFDIRLCALCLPSTQRKRAVNFINCRVRICKKLGEPLAWITLAFRIEINSIFLIPIRNIASRLAQPLIYGILFFCSILVSTASVDDQKMQHLMLKRFGTEGATLLNAWQQLVLELKNQPEQAQIKKVNDFLNKSINYRDDVTLWRKSDYWATPLETLGMRAGDCEDFTIAKYITLLRLGIPPEQLRLIYVKAQIGGLKSKIYQAHMVLGYYPTTDSVPLILDNLISTIEPANKRMDLRPIFSFNSEGLWVGNTQAQDAPTTRLSRWRDLLQRVQEEGVDMSQFTNHALTQVQQ